MRKVLTIASSITVLLITTFILTAGISKDRSGGGKNLVDELYDQALKQNNNLRSIEEDIERFYKKKEDALEKYNSFTSYNNRYYTDAKAKAAVVADVVQKQRAMDIITKSEAAYFTKLSNWQATITILTNNEKELSGLHTLLKIMTTGGMITSYQNTELPDNAKLKDANADLTKVIEKIRLITR